MKRRLFKLVVFVLLGAIVNVAVAWGCAVPSSANTTLLKARSFDKSGRALWQRLAMEGWPSRPSKSKEGSRFGVTLRYWSAIVRNTDTVQGYYMWEKRAGWPMRAVASYGRFDGNDRDELWILGGLPLGPIWPGFAINTTFYAAILWLLALGPFTARRMIRRKYGHCIKCGYDLRGHSGGGACPECGVATGLHRAWRL